MNGMKNVTESFKTSSIEQKKKNIFENLKTDLLILPIGERRKKNDKEGKKTTGIMGCHQVKYYSHYGSPILGNTIHISPRRRGKQKSDRKLI